MIEAPRVRREARKERKGPRREGESSVDCGIRSCCDRESLVSKGHRNVRYETAAAHGWDTYPDAFERSLGVG